MTPLLLGLPLALLAVELVLVFLAQALGRPLRWRVVALGLALPLLALLPWLDGEPLFIPTGALDGQIPGSLPDSARDERAEGLNDAALLFVAWELDVRHAFSAGRLPLWSDEIDGGSSPWINPQAGVLSPISLAARAVPIQHHFLVVFALKMLIAFQGVWVLARLLGLRSGPSVFAGIAVALGGPIACWAMFSHGAVVAWTPWLAAGSVRVMRRARAREIAATAVTAAATLLSGQPEVALGAAVFSALCAVWARNVGRRDGLHPVFRLALAGTLGVALAAPHLIPFLSNLSGTIRAREQVAAPTSTNEEISLQLSKPRTWFRDYQGGYFAAAASRRAFGWPYGEPFRGPIHWLIASQPYVGVAAWGGLFLGVFLGFSRGGRWPLRWAAFGFVVVLLAAQFLPLDLWLQKVPLVRLAEPSRFLPLAGLAFALAAAFGWEALVRRLDPRRLAIAGIALLAAASLSFAASGKFGEVGLWLGTGLAATFAIFRFPNLKRVFWVGLVLALAFDLIPWGRAFQPRGEARWFFPRTVEVEGLERLVRERGGPWRAVGNERLVYPSILPAYGISEIRASDPSASADYVEVLDAAFGYRPSIRQYFSSIGNLEHPMLDFLNVRAVFSNAYLPALEGFESLGGARAPFLLLRNPDALPRFFLPRRIEPVEGARRHEWIAAMADPWTVSVDPRDLDSAQEQASATVEVLRFDRGAIRLKIGGRARRLLATSLTYPRGWIASSGEKRLDPVTIHGAFAGFWVPEGCSEVALEFEPPGFRVGCILFGLAVVGLSVLGLVLPRVNFPA